MNGKKFYIFGLRPEQEAVMKQAMCHLVSSPTLQVLTITLCYDVYNYEDFDLSIHDILSGITFFDQLPKSLQKVTFVIGESGRSIRPEGFVRVHNSAKEEAKRIAKTLVGTPGQQYEEVVVCLQHGKALETCHCTRVVWRFTATSAAYSRAQRL